MRHTSLPLSELGALRMQSKPPAENARCLPGCLYGRNGCRRSAVLTTEVWVFIDFLLK